MKSFSRSSHVALAVSLNRKHFARTEEIADLENCYASVDLVPARTGSRYWRCIHSVDQEEASVPLPVRRRHDCTAVTDLDFGV